MSANNLASASPASTYAQLLHIGTGNFTAGASVLLGDGSSSPLYLGNSVCEFFRNNTSGSMHFLPYQLSIGDGMTGDNESGIDFHSCSGASYDLRIFRSAGINGGGGIVMRGTGNLNFFVLSTATGATAETSLTLTATKQLLPGDTNTSCLGSSGTPWNTAYLRTAASITSDARLKEQVRPLSGAETAVAQALKPLLRAYKMISDVEAHGESAKIRIGILAQEVVAAFAAQGLEASHYSMVHCENDSYSIRYEELLAFMLAAL